MSWTNDIILEFLNLYRKEQMLWDPKNPYHRNRSEVNDAWLRIQSSLSITCSINDLKRKKESLMTSFRMHWHKKKKSPDTYHTSWFAYPLMENFLGGKYECDSTNQIEHEFFGNTVYTPPLIPDHNTTRNVITTERNNIKQSRPAMPISSKISATNTSDYLFTKKQMDDSVTYIKTTNEEKKDLDEYELYGQLLAKKLRKLDEHQRDVAMHEIDNIMFRAKMQSSSSQTTSYSSPSSPIPRKMKSPLFIVAPQNHTHYEDENISYQEHMQGEPPS